MNESINIEAGDMGMVVAFVLMLGGVIKNYTPVKNELIPLITWILGGLLYQWLAGGWADPRQWMMALISVAGATGLHSATRSTAAAVKGSGENIAPPLTLWLICGFLSFGLLTPALTGCATGPQTREAVVYKSFRTTWATVLAAHDVYCERAVLGKVKPEDMARVDAAWNKYRAVFKVTFAMAQQDWTLPAPATLDAAEKELLNLIRTL